MRCLAICQDELVIKVLDEILLPSFDIEFLVDSRTLTRRLTEAGVHITYGDLRRKDTFLKADISRIKADLGWRPSISFEDGVSRILANIDYWREAPLWDPESIAKATKTWFETLSPGAEGRVP